MGTWAAIPEIQDPDEKGNYVSGEVVALGSTGNIVEVPKDKMVALIGVNGLVVVESGNAILVCRKEQAQNIKAVTKEIKGSPNFL